MDHTKEFTISEILVELDNAIGDGTIPKNGAFATMRDEIISLRSALADERDNNARCSEARMREVASFEQAISERNRDLSEKLAAWEEAWHKIDWLRAALKRQFWRAQAERAKAERLREALGKIEQETWLDPKMSRVIIRDIAREVLAATVPDVTR